MLQAAIIAGRHGQQVATVSAVLTVGFPHAQTPAAIALLDFRFEISDFKMPKPESRTSYPVARAPNPESGVPNPVSRIPNL